MISRRAIRARRLICSAIPAAVIIKEKADDEHYARTEYKNVSQKRQVTNMTDKKTAQKQNSWRVH